MLDAAYSLVRPLLFSMDAERAHEVALAIVSRAPFLAPRHPPPAAAAVEFAGLRCPSPVGLAAGLDKDARALPLWERLGFGFVEIGTVTPQPQPGNPRPRIHRLPDQRGVINSMGFPSDGASAVGVRLARLKEAGRWPSIPVGVNLGKNKDTPDEGAAADFAAVADRLALFADYLVVNVSSPNTPGLRSLQGVEPLLEILDAVLQVAQDKPVFVKVSPDLAIEDLDATVRAAVGAGAAGLVATNTTTARPDLAEHLDTPGGLSGAPLHPIARRGVLAAAAICKELTVPLIGVGGITGPEQAREYLDAGCAAVQVYTGLIYAGPGLPSRINRQLYGA